MFNIYEHPVRCADCREECVEFLVKEIHVNEIEYLPVSSHFQRVRCGQYGFILSSSKYDLIPKYTITNVDVLNVIYNQKIECTIENHFSRECSLNRVFLKSKYSFRFSLIPFDDMYRYSYKCPGVGVYPVLGTFSLNQYIWSRGVVKAHIGDCSYQVYSSSTLLNAIKSIYNKITHSVNYRCFIYL